MSQGHESVLAKGFPSSQPSSMYKRDLLRETLVVAEATRKTMKSNRSKNTSPEVALRRQLWVSGVRGYRIHVKNLPGSPDLAFSKSRLAIFVHGCFWHGCPHCSNYRPPKTNAEFWKVKLQENQRRDDQALLDLHKCGYSTLVFWECEVEKDLSGCVGRITKALEAPRRTSQSPFLAPEELDSCGEARQN